MNNALGKERTKQGGSVQHMYLLVLQPNNYTDRQLFHKKTVTGVSATCLGKVLLRLSVSVTCMR